MDDVFWHGTGYVGYLDADQLAWLAGDLALVERGRTVVVALHIPLASTHPDRTKEADFVVSERVNNREALYRLLEPYRAHVLAGHTHELEHIFAGGVHEHVHGTVCGAWWSGDICYDGTPNGYGVYEVAGPELRWRYQPTGHPADHQLRMYRAGGPDRAHGPGGECVGLGSGVDGRLVRGRGPARTTLAADRARSGRVRTQTGPTLPPRRTWVEPTPAAHLFYVALPTAARDIRVEATDRWGRVYVASPEA